MQFTATLSNFEQLRATENGIQRNPQTIDTTTKYV